MQRLIHNPEDIDWRTEYSKWRDETTKSGGFALALALLGKLRPGGKTGKKKPMFDDFQEAVLWNCFCAAHFPEFSTEHRNYVEHISAGATKGAELWRRIQEFYRVHQEFDVFLDDLIPRAYEAPGTAKRRLVVSDVVEQILNNLVSKMNATDGASGEKFPFRYGPLLYPASLYGRTRLLGREACLMVVLTVLNRYWTHQGVILKLGSPRKIPSFGRPASNVVAAFLEATFNSTAGDDDVRKRVASIKKEGVSVTDWPSRTGMKSPWCDTYLEVID